MLNVPSEKVAENEEEENEEEKKVMTLQNDLKILGRFHTTRVNDIQPLGRTTQMASCS